MLPGEVTAGTFPRGVEQEAADGPFQHTDFLQSYNPRVEWLSLSYPTTPHASSQWE